MKAETAQRRSTLPSEKKAIAKDATNVAINNSPQKISKVARNKTDKEIAFDRQSKINETIKAQDIPFTQDNWREVLAKTTQATGDKFRFSNEPNFFDDYVNPAVWVGGMASNLGQAPLRAQQEDSYMPYITAVGTPLAVGAMAGIGTQNTGQFVNNLVNPLAGTGDLVNNLGNKYLPNAYKLNPNAFKPNPDAYYRKIGDEGLKDATESGFIRANPKPTMIVNHPDKGLISIQHDTPTFDKPYFSKGQPWEAYQGKYMAEVKELPMTPRAAYPETAYVPENNITINNPNLKLYKKDWLKGYKQIDLPKTTPIKDLFIQPKQKFSDPQRRVAAKLNFDKKYEGINLTALAEDGLEGACWEGYEAIGTKTLDGREVPNCVPIKD